MIRTISERVELRIVIIVVLLAIGCFGTYYFYVVLETGRVFTHFFYIPIILSSLWWGKKGLFAAIFSAAVLLISHFFIREDVQSINDYYRAAMFIIIALVIAMLSERKAKVEEELRKHRNHLEEIINQWTKELRDAQKELIRTERLATLGQFSGNISHELRNPLGVIDSSAYYLKTKLKDADKKVQEHLNRIQSSVGGANAIIESLLNLTRMKEPQLSGLDLIAITHDAIVSSKVPARVDVIRDFAEAEVMVNADRGQLGIAFNNIVKNAVESMDGGGTLTVVVRRATDGQAEVSFADTGAGIDPEDLDKVFNPLFSSKAKGIGFGLSIAKMVIDKHGGTIEARSEPGNGAIFTVRLPVYADISKEV